MKTIRLGKLAGEVNVGISTIVDFLNQLKIEIDCNPNAKIDEDLYTLVKRYYGPENQEKKLINIILNSKDKSQKDKTTYYPKYIKKEITSYETLDEIKKIKGIPKTIFKFFSNNENALDGIYKSYLYFSHYNSFNDPFDCNTLLIRIPYKSNISVNPKYEEDLKEALNIRGICCFSRNKDSILMWSHYANSHKGFCIEFYENNDSLKFNPIDINYVEQFEKPNFIKNPLVSINHLIYTKAIDWEYENELRLLKKVKSNSIEDRKISYEVEKIKSIYFGIKADKNLCDKIYKHLKLKNKSISFYKGYFNENKFEIKWKKYNIHN